MRHRRARIQFGSFRELTGGFVVIEAEDQRNSLIEKLLRQLRLRIDRVNMIAETLEQLRRRGRRVGMLVLRERTWNQHQGQSDDESSCHIRTSSRVNKARCFPTVRNGS